MRHKLWSFTKTIIWEGVDRQGRHRQGTHDLTLTQSFNLEEIVLTRYKQRIRLHWKGRRHIKTQLITQCLQQLATLLTQQIPLPTALSLLATGCLNTDLKTILCTIKRNITQGCTFTQALADYPEYFNACEQRMVKAGEISKQLPAVLKQLAKQREQHARLQSQCQKALIYPSIVLGIAFCVTAGLLCFALPQFQQLFTQFNATLPWLTQTLINMAHQLQRHGIPFLSIITTCIFCCRILLQHCLHCQKRWASHSLRLPLYRQLILTNARLRWTGTLSMLLKAHLPLLDALKLAQHTVSHHTLRQTLSKAAIAIEQGQAVSQALAQTPLLSPTDVQLLQIGEASGQLAAMLAHIHHNANTRLSHWLEGLSKWLEPVIMLLVALITGVIVLAMYLPIFQIGLLL